MNIHPEPLRTGPENHFAHRTMAERIPQNIEQVVEQNPEYPSKVRASLGELARSIRNNGSIHLFEPPAPDFEEWENAFHSAVRDHATRTGVALQAPSWLDAPWFFAETLAYRTLVSYVRWWETGLDPFLAVKEEELAGNGLWQMQQAALEVDGSVEERIGALIRFTLWGNRIDLSYTDSRDLGMEGSDGDFLQDDTAKALPLLLRRGGSVHIVTDNTGSELAADLAFADRLLTVEGRTVVFHVKLHPTYVSDATAGDLFSLIDRMKSRRDGSPGSRPSDAADRLLQAFEDGRLRVIPHQFWNSSRFLWDMPSGLTQSFRQARILILKGDMNYRRLSGDAIWPPGTRFEDAAGYLPCPLLAVRTLKSDTLIGGPAETVAKKDESEPGWRSGGRYGVIQFSPGQ